jgi:mannitol/fructose-specific phosphotransferase system IIA component (Ntr-type)
MLLSEIFNTKHIKLNLESETKDEAFEELVEMIAASHPEVSRRELLEAVTTRERQMNTVVAPGIAAPHGYCDAVNGIAGAIGISHAGIDYDTDGRTPVRCIFMVVMGEAYRESHLRVLSSLVKLLNSQALEEIRTAKSAQEAHDILCRFEQTATGGLT